MNPHENDHPAPQSPPTQAAGPDPAETVPVGAPEAIAAADVDRPHPADPSTWKTRGVDWVRTSDLMARGSAKASRLAIDFNAHLAHKAHDPLARGAKHLGARARELPPLSAFGRGHRNEPAGRGPVGMS